MSKSGPKAELGTLKARVREFEEHFLRQYLTQPPTLAPPSRKEILDVGAYVVLVHGAFENFVEGLALWALSHVVDGWTKRKRASQCTAAILLHHSSQTVDKEQAVTVYNQLRAALSEVKVTASNAVNQNNGITVQHLRALFYPLGVDVPDDPPLIAALHSVVTMRHHWAHQNRFGAVVARAARDAQLQVKDCLVFAERLADHAASARPY